MLKFYMVDYNDKRMVYAAQRLVALGFEHTQKKSEADFQLLGVNPDLKSVDPDITAYAGNVSGKNIIDYTKDEIFALKNACITAESAVALAVGESPLSLVGSNILIMGYGRIGKTLHRYLSALTSRITVCARSDKQRTLAKMNGADAVDFTHIKNPHGYAIVFNTVPHPVLGKEEITALPEGCLIIDLASFPGGTDRHMAAAQNKKVIFANSLPAKYSPRSAGIIVADTVARLSGGAPDSYIESCLL